MIWREELHPRDREGQFAEKPGERLASRLVSEWDAKQAGRLDLKGDKGLTQPQAHARAKKVVQGLTEFYGGGRVEVHYEPEYLASAGTEARFRHKGERLAGVMYGEPMLRRMKDADYGVADFRVIAHEAAHSLSGTKPGPLPGISQTIEEGSAEILSLGYWHKRGQEFDARDAARVEGRWTTPGRESLAHHVHYRDDVIEVLRRAASRVGWDRAAIMAEVRAIMAEDHGGRIRWRDETSSETRLPEGVANNAPSLIAWLLGGDA
jgi:hypothetical protein